jgi:hypothetical protein
MLKLITEASSPNYFGIKDVMIVENTTMGTKDMYITGPFMQSKVKNRNGRIYDKRVLEDAVKRYVADRMSGPKLRSYGELGHPEGVEINPERISHITTELTWNGDDVIGKAKLVETTYGKIAISLLRADGQLGVSSRGLGELVKEVVNAFELIAVDIVIDPSAPDGFVQGILEGKEYIIEGGSYTEHSINKSVRAFGKLEKSLTSLPKKDVNSYYLKQIENFLKEI